MLKFIDTISYRIDRFNQKIGSFIAYLVLGIVLLQFFVVIMRYVFGVGSIFIQESIIYQHAILIMLGAAYTFLTDEHVRLDIFYRDISTRIKSFINIIGVIFFLLPMCVIIWVTSFPYVSQSWRVLEGSRETSGLPFVYLLKTTILIFSFLLALQGISLLLKSIRNATDQNH